MAGDSIWPGPRVWPPSIVCTKNSGDAAGRPVRMSVRVMEGKSATPAADPNWTGYAIQTLMNPNVVGGKAKVTCTEGAAHRNCSGNVQIYFALRRQTGAADIVAEWQESAQSTGQVVTTLHSFDAAELVDSWDWYRLYLQVKAGTPASTTCYGFALEMEDA